jgi:putative sigma-54 modulation protein
MPFRVSGKNIDVGDALRGRVNQRIADATAKYFDGGYSGHVTIGKEGFGFRTECVVHLDSGIVLEAEAMAGDAYASADQAAERIEKRLRRYKRRLKDRAATRANSQGIEPDALVPSYVIAAPEHDTDDDITNQSSDHRRPTTALGRMSVSEAVMELIRPVRRWCSDTLDMAA